MGNQFVIENDLPPKHTIQHWSDKQFLERISLIKSMSPCSYIAKQMDDVDTVKNMVDEKGNNWAESYYATCLMTYMDKKFYACLKDGKVNTPDDVLVEFERMRQMHAQTPINSDELQRSRVMWSAQQCFMKHKDAMDELKHRVDELTHDKERVQRAYRNFLIMVHSSNYKILPTDKEEDIREKVEFVANNTCKFQLSLNDIEQPNSKNILNFGLLSSDLAHCLVANLCADEIKQCMNASSERTFTKCVDEDPEGNIRRCSRLIAQVHTAN
jgi:hypothetical protein